MALYLLEFSNATPSRAEIRALLDRVAEVVGRARGAVIEAQVPTRLDPVYVVVEHGDERDGEATLGRALGEGGVPAGGIARVRLVGATLDEVKASRRTADYLVEWDFPAGLTMDAYLARKKASAPRYADVPEVRFLRTYVCEDMSKCLCFYLAHDEAIVRRAREVVGAPVTRLARLAGPVDTANAAGTPAPAAPIQASGTRGGDA
jgi:hypothetical protein